MSCGLWAVKLSYHTHLSSKSHHTFNNMASLHSSRTLLPLSRPLLLRPSTQFRAATTSSLPHGTSSTSSRRSVTLTSDTGSVPWGQLSAREKLARTTQQSFNLGLILLGLGMTGGVATVLYLEVFSGDSKIAVFNRTADRIKKDERCIELLAGRGKGREIQAYGEASWSRWARNRFIAYVCNCKHEAEPQWRLKRAPDHVLRRIGSGRRICICISTSRDRLRRALSTYT